MKQQLKLIDRTFSHSILGYCSDYQTSDLFVWDRTNSIQNGEIVVITDMALSNFVNGAKNIAWLIEPIDIAPQNYSIIQSISNNFNKIFTHEKTLLDLGSPYEFIPFGCCWILKDDQKIYPKNKMLSIIASNKFQTNGHKLRHSVINQFKNKIDVYGRGWNPIDYKLDGLKDYRYSIVIENCKRDYWFTEKLIDALVCGTIPIYWGCPSIGDFFDTRGFIIFDNLNDLSLIIENLTEEKYNEMKPYIEANFIKAKEYMLPDDYIYKKLNYE